jgi:NADH dehydrogenase
MKIFVTGGTGFLGLHIVEELMQSGFDVFVLVRNKKSAKHLPLSRIILGDLFSLSIEDISNFDIVIHTAAIKTSINNNELLENINENGTKHLVNICEKAGIKRFIHISSMAVDAGRGDSYALSKEIAERYVQSSTLEWSILRLSVVYGLSDWWRSYLNILIRKKIIIVVGDGKHLVYQIYVKDCARLIIGSIFKEELVYKICYITSEPITYNDYLSIIKTTLNASYKKLHIPLWMAKIIALFFKYIFNSPKPHYSLDPRSDLSLGVAMKLEGRTRTFEHGLEDMLLECSVEDLNNKKNIF